MLKASRANVQLILLWVVFLFFFFLVGWLFFYTFVFGLLAARVFMDKGIRPPLYSIVETMPVKR